MSKVIIYKECFYWGHDMSKSLYNIQIEFPTSDVSFDGIIIKIERCILGSYVIVSVPIIEEATLRELVCLDKLLNDVCIVDSIYHKELKTDLDYFNSRVETRLANM